MTLNPEHTPVFRRGYRLQWEQVQNSHVILYPEGMAERQRRRHLAAGRRPHHAERHHRAAERPLSRRRGVGG